VLVERRGGRKLPRFLGRFIETEMLPHDAEARRRGHVGHELWRQAGELGFLCVDIPEEWGGAGGDFRHEAVLHEEMTRRALSGMGIGVHSIARIICLTTAPRTRRAGICRASLRGNWSARSR
jgi:alkylation response protein AidB-like acyl-CoA dehydrogenase